MSGVLLDTVGIIAIGMSPINGIPLPSPSIGTCSRRAGRWRPRRPC